jgi:hypothetical protein
VEAGPNTSTVALRVIGGDEKGSLESETVKYLYGHQVPRDSDQRMTVLQRASSNCKQQTHPLVSEVTPSVQLKNKNSGRGSQGACRQDELIGGKPPVVK